MHIVLQNYLQNSAGDGKANKHAALQAKQRNYRKHRSVIRSPVSGTAVWQDYAQANSYTDDEVTAKRTLIQRFAAQHSPAMLWDLGCKTGDCSKAALEAGAGFAVGFDFDQEVLELACARAREEDLNFLPLFLDAITRPPTKRGHNVRGEASRREPARTPFWPWLTTSLSRRIIPLDRVVVWLVSAHAQIVHQKSVSQSGRLIVWYKRES